MKIYLLAFFWLLIPLVLVAQEKIEIQFSEKAGFYSDTILMVKIVSKQKGLSIYYTTNGASPSSKSKKYGKAIPLDTTKVLRAIAFANGNKSEVITNTYFIGEDSTHLPILSVSIPAYTLFDPVKGLFVKGPRASNKFPFKGANYFSRREIPCFIEIFETDKEKVWQSKVGFKIFGGMSRIFPQKSFSLYASKSKYGKKYIKYPIFEDKKLQKYKRLVVRNSGSDFGETHFRDALITSFGAEMGLETQAYRPVIVYINGQYWGLYNFREKLTKHYIADNFGWHKDSISIIEHRKDTKAGSRDHYDKMRIFMRRNDLKLDKNYQAVSNMMDIDNFMEYQILQIYIDNQDAGGNIKFWRPNTKDGKWRWILFDTDFGMGHYGRNGYKNNSLAFHTKPNGPRWPNPPWSTLNLRSLLQNKDFQVKFISRFLDRMNYTLDSNRVMARIDQFANHIKPEMPKHWARWKLPERRWYREIKRMKEFASKRPAFIRQYIQKAYPWVGKEVALTTQIDSGGYIMLNKIIPVKGKFTGTYFQKIPVSVTAKPYFGYIFSHWNMDGDTIKGRTLALRFDSDKHHLKAVFKKGKHPASRQMIINEFVFKDTAAGDWIEFYNDTDKSLDITGWKIVDRKGNVFAFPAAKIGAKKHLVVCNKPKEFIQKFPSCKNYIGGLTFGLDNRKDNIMLYDAEGLPVDSIGYSFSRKKAAKLQGLVLTDFDANNKIWKKLKKAGSPASVNPEYVEIKKAREWNNFLELVKIGGITAAIFIGIILAYILVRKKIKD